MNNVAMDLNVQLNTSSLRPLINRANELGYNGVALNEVINDHELKSWKQTPINMSIAHGTLDSSAIKRSEKKLQNRSSHIDLALPSNPTMKRKDFHVLRRVTVVLNDPQKVKLLHKFGENLGETDLFAIHCMNQVGLVKALETVQFDILSLDFSTNEFVTIKRHLVQHIQKKGVMVELNIGSLLEEDGKGQSRIAVFIRSMSSLTRFISPDRILLTTGANTPLKLRSPSELIAFAHVIGLQKLTPKMLSIDNVLSALYKSGCRRSSCGAIIGFSNTEDICIAENE